MHIKSQRLPEQTGKQIKGPDGAPLNKTHGMPQWAHRGSSTRCWATRWSHTTAHWESLRKKPNLYYFIITDFFFYFQQNPVISKYRPRGTNTARVKSNIGVLWYGDQFFCWVKRFININHGTFAYVTHRHNLSWENWEQNLCNSSMCRFLITRSKMAMAVTWARTVYLAGSQTTKAYC